jgi:primosomal protein N' (replication factor Y)
METCEAPQAAERIPVVDVVVDSKSGGIESVWTYRLNGAAVPGEAFFVPLGPRAVIGFATHSRLATEAELGFKLSQLRSVLQRIEGLSLPLPLMQLVDHVSARYLCPFSLCLSAAIPSGVRDRLVTAWSLLPGAERPQLTPLEKEVLKTLEASGGRLTERPGRKLPPSTQRALRGLRNKGLLEHGLQLLPIDERASAKGMIRLTTDTAKIETFLKKEGKRRPAQALTIMRLQTGDPVPLAPSEIKALSGITDTTLKAMLESGLLERVDEHCITQRQPPTPNAAQSEAIDAITGSISDKQFCAFLLNGVTGSGKTEVYLRAAAEALKNGRQVLYLVPEIALAAQAISQLRDRFGQSVSLLHSDIAAKERLETWIKIREGRSPVVLGARSALFAPLDNIGLIIVDEEHETSYKQESAPRYHAKELALELGRIHHAAVVLGSATPSIESAYEAKNGALQSLSMPYRTASATLPTVEIIDLAQGYRDGSPAILTEDLETGIREGLERGEQVILFLNRRAYAPFLMCRDCGEQFKCPRCAVSLSYSRAERRLRCHHCGYYMRPPDLCPKCGGKRLSPFGIGTEKVEEAVAATFPNHKVARLDRDVTKKKGALEEVLAKFRSGETSILVGTQMVAKGLDFPNVTVVGVIVADISLNMPDFRSSERTFQLLSQVAGRAGRGSIPGKVYIQTFNPDHPAIQTAREHNYEAFYQVAIQERQEAVYPPFVQLANIVLTGEDLEKVRAASEEVSDLLQGLEDSIVLGPTECVIERLQNRWRLHLLVKMPPESSIGRLGQILNPLSWKGVGLVADVDPYSLF